MKDLKIFNNNEFGEVRTSIIDDEPYFALNDVCTILEIKNTRDAKSRLNPKGVATTDILTNGGPQQANFINESNLYKLVFQSRKPEAERFADWVTSEVLPSIRRDGGYMVANQGESDEDILSRAMIIAKKNIERLKLESKKKDQIIGELKPKADYVDKILQNTSLIKVSSIAKDYGMSAYQMNKLLHDLKIQYKQGDQWLLYANIQDKGYTSSETHVYPKKDGTTDVRLLTKWTQKGRIFLYEELKRNGYLPMIERNAQ